MAGDYDTVPTTHAPPRQQQTVLLAAVYGFVASLMCAPVMMSFAAIIFADPFFKPFAPELVKLVLFSSAVHQLCYVKYSTMPFAVGQVQDAGLIFLSSMARYVVRDGEAHGDDDATTMAAALWTLGLATALLGVSLIVFGRLRLASLAMYLPVPVVGGYLAYIGFYCGQAGLAMMAGVEVTRLSDWPKLFHGNGPAKMAVGVVVVAAIVCTSSIAEKQGWSRAAKALIMPLVLVATCVTFYAALYAGGVSLDQARHHGWVGALPTTSHHEGDGTWRSVPVLRPWSLYAPHNNAGDVLQAVGRIAPRLLPSWLAMVCVVAFSSSLDIAAVEMELGSPLNYDSELQTVGLGNLASGLLGGFSGSYIFSQTILNLRSKVANRWSGAMVGLAELLLVFAFKAPPTAFAPTGAFGGLLLLIGASLLGEWLIEARHRFSFPEYLVLLFTFLSIHLVGLEAGFAAGLTFSALAFACQYASVHDETGGVACRRSKKTRSVRRRSFEERRTLHDQRERIVALDVGGFVFLGAAAALLAKLKEEAKGASWIVLDFSECVGLDATAARSCFAPFKAYLEREKCALLVAGLRPHVAETLKWDAYATADQALEAAEDGLLARFKVSRASFAELRDDEDGFEAILRPYVDEDVDSKALEKYVEAASVKAGERLFRRGDSADCVYFVRAGTVDLNLDDRRIARVTRGAVLGELCFLLKQRQSLDATAHTHCALWVLSRTRLDAMKRERPDLFNVLQTALLKSMALQVEESLGSGLLSG